MEPIAVTIRGERRWMLIHRCARCGRLRMNRTAADDNVLLLMQLAALPLATPPLPHHGGAAGYRSVVGDKGMAGLAGAEQRARISLEVAHDRGREAGR